MKVNGIILSGGDNIGDHPERDKTEFEVIDYAIEKKIPIFGVCRGMQILNKYFGGSVVKSPTSIHVANPHPSQLTREKLSTLFMKNILTVNSFHNNVITKENLGNELNSFAFFDEDKTIEGFVHKELPILAVMWHPERDQNNDNELLLNNFFNQHILE